MEDQKVAAVEGQAGSVAGWEVAGPQHFQPLWHHQPAVAAGAVSQSQGLVCLGTGGPVRSLEVCWHMEANCCGVVGAAEDWSLLHFAAAVAGPEVASAAVDVVESSLFLLPHHHLHLLEFAGTGDEGDVGEASLQAAAVAAVLQDQDPFPAVGLEAWPESGSGE